jgi:hypothetical protein
MTNEPTQTAIHGASGDTCGSCGAALNFDQRYCLACGTRRAGTGLHFQQILASDSAAASTTGVRSGAASPDAARSSLPALASIACLLLALGVGVVIGNSGGSSSNAATPPVISVGAGGATTDTTGGTTTDTTSGKKKGASSTGDASSAGASKATNTALKKLENLSPEEYQKQSLKLPKTVETGGKPPPKDNKAPANGGSFETIG